jgi:ERCC4-type nuclease
VDDFLASVYDGRWQEQRSRLFATGYRVLFILEGDLRSDDQKAYGTLLGAWVNAELRQSHCFRTWDLYETFMVLKCLAKKATALPASVATGGVRPPRLKSKRTRDGEVRVCWVRQLMCVPSISEAVATKLLDHFGSLTAIQEALREPKQFPAIQLSAKSKIGKARISKLAKYLS